MKDENRVDPEKDCGTNRCIYSCEKCPFEIPERVEHDPKSVKC